MILIIIFVLIFCCLSSLGVAGWYFFDSIKNYFEPSPTPVPDTTPVDDTSPNPAALPPPPPVKKVKCTKDNLATCKPDAAYPPADKRCNYDFLYVRWLTKYPRSWTDNDRNMVINIVADWYDDYTVPNLQGLDNKSLNALLSMCKPEKSYPTVCNQSNAYVKWLISNPGSWSVTDRDAAITIYNSWFYNYSKTYLYLISNEALANMLSSCRAQECKGNAYIKELVANVDGWSENTRNATIEIIRNLYPEYSLSALWNMYNPALADILKKCMGAGG